MPKEQKTILHIVTRDKFTAGYINFMKKYMTDWTHIFFTYSFNGTASDLNLINDENVIIFNTRKEGILSPSIRRMMSNCDKIIVSGVFCDWEGFYPKKLIKKMYLQFWGADIDIRAKKMPKYNPFRYIKILGRKRLIKYAAGIINLVEGDYNIFVEKNKIKKVHFIAPVPPNPLKKINMENYRNIIKTDNITRIILGNSATRTNQHLEALDMLEHLKSYPIEIYCPLSYGADKDYKDEVIKHGKDIFGDKFIPITEFMDYYNYVSFLSTCDIGIFNNNRQQGLGNILILIGMGKKVFLNSIASTYDELIKKNYIISKAETLKQISYKELIEFPQDKILNNINRYDEESKIEKKCDMWRSVFNYRSEQSE